jgi:hypothetical protein
LFVTVVFLPVGAKADSLAESARESRVIVVADVAPDGSIPMEEGGTLRLVASRVLKGTLRSRSVAVRLTPEMARNGFPATGIWFLGREAGGAFEVVEPPIKSVWDPVEMISKVTHRPISGLTPDSEGNWLALTLGMASRLGTAEPSPKHAVDRKDVLLVAQLTNFGATRVVTPPLDGSRTGRRYPKVLLEIRDQAGRTPPRRGRAGCGNMNPFAREDFVELQSGDALSFTVDTRDYLLGPGRYRARLRYVASRALHPGKEPTVAREARTKFDQMWEGTVESNWVSFTVNQEGADEVPDKPTAVFDRLLDEHTSHRQPTTKR